MTRLIHDQFAKDYLSELLSPIGVVNPGREVASEVRQIDVYFTPTTRKPDYRDKLGLLGKMAETTALFEPFRNGVTVNEVQSCVSKLLAVKGEIERQSRRENTRPSETELPKLWILTPTGSETLLNGFHAIPDEENWGKGIYFLGESWRTAIVVIHHLPKTPETLWLRILGRGEVQEKAIASLSAMPVDDPLRIVTLELVYQLQSSLARRQEKELEKEDKGLIMAVSPLFQEQLAAAEKRGEQRGEKRGEQRGIERGEQRGFQQGQRLIIESFLQGRFGELSEIMASLVEPLSMLPPIDLTRLLLQLSQLTGDASGIGQGEHLIVESLLQFRFGELDEEMMKMVDSLLALPPVDLRGLFLRLTELSRQELLGFLG